MLSFLYKILLIAHIGFSNNKNSRGELVSWEPTINLYNKNNSINQGTHSSKKCFLPFKKLILKVICSFKHLRSIAWLLVSMVKCYLQQLIKDLWKWQIRNSRMWTKISRRKHTWSQPIHQVYGRIWHFVKWCSCISSYTWWRGGPTLPSLNVGFRPSLYVTYRNKCTISNLQYVKTTYCIF